jgi:hypothetical protein
MQRADCASALWRLCRKTASEAGRLEQGLILMRTINPLNSMPLSGLFRARAFVPLAVFAAALGGAPTLTAQAPATAAAPVPAHKQHAQHKRSAAVHAKHTAAKAASPAPEATALPAAVPAKPAEPELPKWPVNEKPALAVIHWDSKGLRIEAANSSLQQILQDVTTTTGAKVQGLDTDERVFGAYGPGTARDVLSQLLQGTGYNVIMIGDQGQGTPREIVLSSRHGGAAQPAATAAPDSDDDDADADEQPQPAPPPIRPGFPPGGQRTPQQITQEMQQRQQELREHQPPGQPPNNAQPQ